MLGEKISETKGKRLVRRVLSVDPPTAEVSFEDSGNTLGIATTGSMLYFRTASQQLARLNNTCGVFEYEVDASGGTTSTVWEWK